MMLVRLYMLQSIYTIRAQYFSFEIDRQRRRWMSRMKKENKNDLLQRKNLNSDLFLGLWDDFIVDVVHDCIHHM